MLAYLSQRERDKERDQGRRNTMDGTIPKPGVDPRTVLRVSEHFLRRRHFDDCRKYALQVNEIDPTFPGVSKILAVADVLLAAKTTETLTDWYSVLQLNHYSHDSDLIRQRFHHLYALLDPSNNNFPLVDEAFGLVCDAWYVLSNPLKKIEFDDALRKHLDGEKSNGKCDFSFWTVCPYCYYLYEFPRVYVELCLRCPNEKCTKAFTCVEIDRPPAEVLIKGKYLCAGFLPVGFQDGSWNPFTPSKKEKVIANDAADNFVEILDDDDEDDDNFETKSDKSYNVSDEGVHEGPGSVKKDAGMLDMRRKKSVATRTKKLTGTGNRVNREGFLHREETDLNVPSTDIDDDVCKNEFGPEYLGGPIDLMNGGEVEFYDADDDILVSLHNDI